MEIKETKKFTKEVINEIKRIEDEEKLTAENIIKNAKKRNNPLHNLFEWNDTKAGTLFRLQQARILINEVKVTIEGEDHYLYENIKVKIDSPDIDEEKEEDSYKRIYMKCTDIKNNEEYKNQMIGNAIHQLIYWRNKYNFYASKSILKNVFKEIEKIEKAI